MTDAIMIDTVITIIGRAAMMVLFFSLVFCACAFVLIGIGAVADAAKAKKRKAALAKAGGEEVSNEQG